MRFLLDKSPAVMAERLTTSSARDLVLGQLITPLTGYTNWGGVHAIDNGAYSGFDQEAFARILKREEPNQRRCLFVTVPDIVGNARRTLEIYRHRDWFVNVQDGWIPALVAQDGLESLDVPWQDVPVLFIGGRDPWKDSQACQDLVKTAKVLCKHVHVGRVNTLARFLRFADLGADTCEGNGASMYDHMLEEIHAHMLLGRSPDLLDEVENHV